MTTFKSALQNVEQYSTTENGAVTLASSLDSCVDLFFKIGAWRNSTPDFALVERAFSDNPNVATRIVAWCRDVRGGAGERNTFRQILNHFGRINLNVFEGLCSVTPEVGRWDDLLAIENDSLRVKYAYPMIQKALNDDNALCAKWVPRKGPIAVELRKYMGLTPKQYRKTLVSLSSTVEQQMCANQWDEIEFSHVPSVAFSRYQKAFSKHQNERFGEFIKAVTSGEQKINASAIFPHDVFRGIYPYFKNSLLKNYDETSTEAQAVLAQWGQLKNFIPEGVNVLPMIDTSCSMSTVVALGVTAMDVATSLGLYCSEKQEGSFKDVILTFSETPELYECKGNVFRKMSQIYDSDWGFNTDLQKAFELVLDYAVRGNVPQKGMPTHVIIFSDMEFDVAVNGETNFDAAKTMFDAAGYKLPNVVFWNLHSRNKKNVPVRADESGAVLVSGFSAQITESVLGVTNINPRNIMLETVMKDRYKVL